MFTRLRIVLTILLSGLRRSSSRRGPEKDSKQFEAGTSESANIISILVLANIFGFVRSVTILYRPQIKEFQNEATSPILSL